jgi:sRNA-binding carbon storage regulator CsrA
MALTIKRKEGQAIRIGPHITVTLGKTRGSHTAIHIEAPRSVPVWRAEVEDFHAGGDDDGDDICGGGVSARTDDSASDAVSVDTEHRAQDPSDNRRKACSRRG